MRLPELETERLIIRPFARTDADAIDIYNRAMGDPPHRQDWLEWVSRNADELVHLYQPPYGDRALILRATGELIGSVGLVPAFGPFGLLPGFDVESGSAAARFNTPEFGLFWSLAPAHRGNGYATEAGRALIDFASASLNLRRIVATTEYDNAASIAVMRRLGMRIERNPHSEPAWFQIVGVRENPRLTT